MSERVSERSFITSMIDAPPLGLVSAGSTRRILRQPSCLFGLAEDDSAAPPPLLPLISLLVMAILVASVADVAELELSCKVAAISPADAVDELLLLLLQFTSGAASIVTPTK